MTTAQFLPDRTYTDADDTLAGGADRIDLYYFGAGHTNGDTIVVFPTLRVAHTGDLFARPATPLIDVNNGGSGVSYPDTIREAAASIKDVDTVIPGHTPTTTTWTAFAEFGEFNAAFLAATKEAMSAGKSVEDAVADLKLPENVQGLRHAGRQGQRHEDLRRVASQAVTATRDAPEDSSGHRRAGCHGSQPRCRTAAAIFSSRRDDDCPHPRGDEVRATHLPRTRRAVSAAHREVRQGRTGDQRHRPRQPAGARRS